MNQFFAAMFSSAGGSRSTVLKTALWTLGLVLSGLLLSPKLEAGQDVQLMLVRFSYVAFALVVGSFLYCLFTNPDLLRSETYNLEKTKIEKSVIGDSTSGFKELGEVATPLLISDSSQEPRQ